MHFTHCYVSGSGQFPTHSGRLEFQVGACCETQLRPVVGPGDAAEILLERFCRCSLSEAIFDGNISRRFSLFTPSISRHYLIVHFTTPTSSTIPYHLVIQQTHTTYIILHLPQVCSVSGRRRRRSGPSSRQSSSRTPKDACPFCAVRRGKGEREIGKRDFSPLSCVHGSDISDGLDIFRAGNR